MISPIKIHQKTSTTESSESNTPINKEESIFEKSSEYLKLLNSVNQENTNITIDVSNNTITHDDNTSSSYSEESSSYSSIKKPVENKLNNIDSYTLDQLRNMAKKYNISLSIKVGKKWKSLNKTELYNELFNYFNK